MDAKPHWRSPDRLAKYRQIRSEEAHARWEAREAIDPTPTVAQVKAWRGDYGSKVCLDSHGRGFWLLEPQPGWAHPDAGPRFFENWSNRRDIPSSAARLDAKCFPKGLDFERAIALRRIARVCWNSAKKRAEKYKISINVTAGEVDALLWAQDMRCAISGIPFKADRADDTCYRSPFRPSLDRIDSSKGYDRGNVRLVLTLVNLAMSEWGEAALIEVARAIAARHPAAPPVLGGNGAPETLKLKES